MGCHWALGLFIYGFLSFFLSTGVAFQVEGLGAEECIPAADAFEAVAPGAKTGGCMMVTCLPDSIEKGMPFTATLRWCVQRPRLHQLSVSMSDPVADTFYWLGSYYRAEEPAQCVETSLELAVPRDSSDDVQLLYYTVPVWLGVDGEGQDIPEPYPNILTEGGSPFQPAYGELVNDCPKVPTRTWNLVEEGTTTAIDLQVNECLEPGEPWTAQAKVFSLDQVDLHGNLMVGSGEHGSLGENDEWVTGFKMPIEAGATINDLAFTAAETALVGSPEFAGRMFYLSVFLTLPDDDWTQQIERESLVRLYYCDGIEPPENVAEEGGEEEEDDEEEVDEQEVKLEEEVEEKVVVEEIIDFDNIEGYITPLPGWLEAEDFFDYTERGTEGPYFNDVQDSIAFLQSGEQYSFMANVGEKFADMPYSVLYVMAGTAQPPQIRGRLGDPEPPIQKMFMVKGTDCNARPRFAEFMSMDFTTNGRFREFESKGRVMLDEGDQILTLCVVKSEDLVIDAMFLE